MGSIIPLCDTGSTSGEQRAIPAPAAHGRVMSSRAVSGRGARTPAISSAAESSRLGAGAGVSGILRCRPSRRGRAAR
ncbi:hypothetical protein ACOBQB_36035 [Streptomyces sp. G5(2025)]|uniref:hypothetical protein n=1 Tax=Streptomyces sp. G5(2025) TaxID=3406628 RepID=UPI003C182037